MAPWVGRQTNNWGRRPLLLIGLGALPIRALLFALIDDPSLLLAFQSLDGISGAVVGVLTALVIADLTNGTDRFNLAQGLVGTASGIGASLSTVVFGVIAASFGRTIVFLSIAAVALAARVDHLAPDARDEAFDRSKLQHILVAGLKSLELSRRSTNRASSHNSENSPYGG